MKSSKKRKGIGQSVPKRQKIPTLGESFLAEHCRDEVVGARQYFVQREGETSVEKTTGTDHIIYFYPFRNYSLVIVKIPSMTGTFSIPIKPDRWAKAFIQLNFLATTEFLQKAIVTPYCWEIIRDDIVARNNVGEIVQIGANWMMSKFDEGSNIDPWSFPLDYDKILKLPRPSRVDSELIRDALIIDDHAKTAEMFNATQLAETAKIQPLMDAIADNRTEVGFRDVPMQDDNALEEMGAPFAETFEAAIQEEETYDKIYKRFVLYVKENGSSMNTAQIAAALTKSTIPNNRDQFVDAVQFSEHRWKHATKEYNIGRIAAKLSSTIIRLDFDILTFSSIDDLCPVKRLAIYRGAKFMDKKRLANADEASFLEQFDSEILSHNSYPTIEECRQIDKQIFLNAKGVIARMDNLEEMPELDARSNHNCLGVATNPQQNVTPPDGINSVLFPDNNTVQDEGSVRTTETCTHNGSVSVSTPSGKRGTTDIVISSPTPGAIRQKIIANLSPQNPELLPENGSPQIISGSKGPNAKNLCIVEKSLHEYLSFPKNHINGGVEPILMSRNCSSDSWVVILTVHDEFHTSRRHAFCKSTWTDLLENYKSMGAKSVGKNFLLSKIFVEYELKTQCPTGRKSQNYGQMGILDEKRQQQVLDALRYCIENEQVSNPKLSDGVWSPTLEILWRKKVLHEGSSQIRARLNNI